MKVEIHFRPEKGPKQILYADLPQREVEEIEAVIARPDADDAIVWINSATTRGGQTHKWMFRGSRITITRVD